MAHREEDKALYIEASLLRGVAFNQLGDCADALAQFEQVLEVDPDNGEARLELAIALFELGRFELATGNFEGDAGLGRRTLGLSLPGADRRACWARP